MDMVDPDRGAFQTGTFSNRANCAAHPTSRALPKAREKLSDADDIT
jgi:hypothetical protein